MLQKRKEKIITFVLYFEFEFISNNKIYMNYEENFRSLLLFFVFFLF